MKEEDYHARVRQAREAMPSLVLKGIKVLHSILDDGQDSVRVQAAKAIFDVALKEKGPLAIDFSAAEETEAYHRMVGELENILKVAESEGSIEDVIDLRTYDEERKK